METIFGTISKQKEMLLERTQEARSPHEHIEPLPKDAFASSPVAYSNCRFRSAWKSASEYSQRTSEFGQIIYCCACIDRFGPLGS